ncbi:alkaline phosphatase D family protein [Flexithrix dorotheae]|uniref:alkaline phosphatase D family protein n=1 Tax=Flexithrix dorotheae TaxID=70993 RepID=UPI0012F75954|nr:alkaline phosphatase D family protein [Flexithrix dorotheae]
MSIKNFFYYSSYILILSMSVSLWSCEEKSKEGHSTEIPPENKLIINKENPEIQLSTIAIGSCNHEYDEQVIWPEIRKNTPDLWVWLGDIIYGDSEDIEVLKGKYDLQKSNAVYAEFIKNIPTIGIWDDHDYGVNDGDKNYKMKEESRDILLDFLDVPKSNAVWGREGAYNAFSFGNADKKVKIILLDARYFRDELEDSEDTLKRYEINEKGDILGEEQWKWLEKELENSDARVNIIASGIQVLPEEQVYEKWDNFPKARTRFLELISNSKAKGIILISGDRHIAEISKIELPGQQEPIYEFTSSGLTHTWGNDLDTEENKYRVGDLIIKKNFGIIKIDWDSAPLEAVFEVRGTENQLFQETEIILN